MTCDRTLSSYNYDLPSALIAQNPVIPRDSSRLLVVNSLHSHNHTHFRNLGQWLQPGDLLVLNNTKVIPARVRGRKITGAPVEILLLEEKAPDCWLALVKPGRHFPINSELYFESEGISLKGTVISKDEATGGRLIRFELPDHGSLLSYLEELGTMPLPPYIQDSQSQPHQYQTVYAQQPGAVAAPTAGLHFTENLLQSLTEQGINQAYVTLHVGIGTFRPVKIEDITNHQMHQEWIDVPLTTVEQIEKTKAQGGRIIAVGTTVVRALEGAIAASGEQLAPFCGKTDIFIYPGYRWRVVEGLITNFHLPCSSLLMLVSALIGRERLLSIYQDAIAHQYRFFSFGDAMLILPEARIC